jgi:hypothetical protein
MAGAFCIGTVYKVVVDVPSPATILMCREAADFALYQLSTYFVESSRGKAAIYAFTNLSIGFATLSVLRRKEIIGFLGTAFFLSLMGVEFFCKVSDFSKYRL